jgi:hypothetical protein
VTTANWETIVDDILGAVESETVVSEGYAAVDQRDDPCVAGVLVMLAPPLHIQNAEHAHGG